MEKSDTFRQRREAVSRMRATLPSEDLRLADFMARVNARHVDSLRDTTLALNVRKMKQSILDVESDDQKSLKILFILGDSNAGKTALVENLLKGDPSFQRYTDSDGVEACPVLYIRAPAPCTLRNLAVRLLARLGYPVKGDISESRAWGILQEQIQVHKVLFVVIDEAQRTMKIDNPVELQKVSDSFITLVDDENWPVRLILIGVPPLETLRNRDPQMKNRSRPQRLGPVPHSKVDKVEEWVREIVCVHAGMRIGDFDANDFAKRLIHACVGSMGSMIILLRSAIESAAIASRDVVNTADFARAYHDATGCPKSENIFETSKWEKIAPGQAKAPDKPDTEGEEGIEEESAARASSTRGSVAQRLA